jgi:hypothetical protein
VSENTAWQNALTSPHCSFRSRRTGFGEDDNALRRYDAVRHDTNLWLLRHLIQLFHAAENVDVR